MTASSEPCMAPPRYGRSRAAGRWRLLGAWLLAVGSLLAASSDACVLPPPFEAMDPVNPKPYYKIGEKVEYRCKKGYSRLPFFLMVSTCEKNHSWVPITDDGCVKIKCTYLNPPPKGKIEYINGTHEWGDHVHFTCVDGFHVVGNERLSCDLKGDYVQWSGSIPKCEKVLCDPPPKIRNGKYTFSDVQVFEYFEAVTYSCDDVPGPDKLSLVGNEVLYCAGHKVWSSAVPECKVVKCPLPVVKNGRQIAGLGTAFFYQATVKFECIPGYYLNGSDTTVCNSESAWDPPLPKCLKGYPNPREGLFDQELNIWIIILLILIAVVGLAVLVLIVRRLFEHHKKSQQEGKTNQKTGHLKDQPSLSTHSLRKPVQT
ncbi:PREDICTED: membrane cofactor protein isoform X3 [Chinchilla lanigera]|uniref:membrane cofactor protein isoform X3 n=1 Tax=Chinchilla lanigera TaxID=34839 RepID=UPI00038E990F|nr:PREDICTED: membrane cofactor protein isoform X3 [Chinchilla lanigera]